ncbi:hypothetical protein B0H19DRAFT_582341 [Mycena capillaripes]|nr:hypothetical protein B0H19DRAFT_582341 [Mycena capillaripes]
MADSVPQVSRYRWRPRPEAAGPEFLWMLVLQLGMAYATVYVRCRLHALPLTSIRHQMSPLVHATQIPPPRRIRTSVCSRGTGRDVADSHCAGTRTESAGQVRVLPRCCGCVSARSHPPSSTALPLTSASLSDQASCMGST